MAPQLRAALAYLAGRLTTGKNANGVYDYSRSKQVMLSGAAEGGVVSVYDHDQKCHISGTANGPQYFLFHHGLRWQFCLILQGSEFSAHDYGRSTPVTGWVLDDGVVVVEPAISERFGYTLKVTLDPPWKEVADKAEPEKIENEPPPP